MQPLLITSTSNPKFRYLQSLRNAKVRKQDLCSAVEGHKEIEMLLEAGWEVTMLFYVAKFADHALIDRVVKQYQKAEFIELDENLFSKVSYRDSTGGMIAVVKTQSIQLKDLKPVKAPLFLIVDGVEKPGNLGAILRTADAANIDAVLCCNLPGDVYNPNVIRASLGTIFTVPLVVAKEDEIMQWLKENSVKVFCSNLHQATDYFEQNYTSASAIVVGTEATGVSQSWIDFADVNVKVPMLGKIDSMNVSVAAAIMLYEARRQRMKK
ncbi:MAG TPA: RNA methyltransferase [Bacteroidia bacterium]